MSTLKVQLIHNFFHALSKSERSFRCDRICFGFRQLSRFVASRLQSNKEIVLVKNRSDHLYLYYKQAKIIDLLTNGSVCSLQTLYDKFYADNVK